MTKPKIRSGTRRSSMRPRGYGSSWEQAFWYPSGMEIHCEVNGMCPPPMANYSPFPHNVRLSCMHQMFHKLVVVLLVVVVYQLLELI